ncbi:hypothetical protein B9Z55_010274 [Caenorhabditis nigoni]|uniref:BRCT domain-containing protein n=2 Tax=Caenorhabditis nigoni TaxID=1611254 RepID=A0A2G5UF52_9PELO|nr:hypothetical protein B9Z55_010274 [Caenorhabditis nigoni]
MMKRVQGLVEYMSSSKSIEHPVFTAGFVNMADLSKVSEDVDSKWFKTEIAKGKPIDKMKVALKPFNEFASNMNSLEKVWKSLEETIQEGTLTAFQEFFRLNPQFDSFSEAQYDKVINVLQPAYTDCWKNTPSGNMSKYVEMKNSYEKLDLVFQSVTAMVTWIDETVKKTNPNYEQVLNQLEKTEMDYNNQKYIHTIENIPNYDSLKQLIERFERLQGLQKELITNAKMVNEGNPKLVFGVKDLVEEWNLAEKQDCLKRKKDLDVGILITLTTALEYAFKFVKDLKYSTIQNVLQAILEVRKQLLSLAKFVEELEKKYDSVESVKTVLLLKNSSSLAHSLGSGMHVIQHMTEVLRLSDNLKQVMEYDGDAIKVIMRSEPPMDVLKFFEIRKSSIKILLNEIDILEKSAEDLKGKDLLRMGSVFEKALKVLGIPNVFEFAYSELKKSGYITQADKVKELKDLDLNFASHKGDLNAASLSLSDLRDFFDELFDLKVKPTSGVTRIISDPVNIIIGCVVVVILLGIGFILIYGLTKTGKERYKKLYLYYFGKQEDFEKRWRYSLFLDRVDITKNVICDAVREVNSQNLLAAVKSGAYINVYNKFGNTGLHVATKRGHYQLVDILIRHGADRTLLNAENKTPEQMIKVINTTIKNEEEKEEVEKYKKVEMIYNKYRKKKFGKSVPNTFPTTSFHIYIDDRTEEKVTYKFMAKFESITSHEPLPTTTHCIVKTDENGVLESDDFNLLSWIFNGVIIVKESWMTDCLQNPKLISKDIDYLVNTVKYNGVVYENAILPWSLAMAKGTMPYLYGVQVAVVMKDYPNLFTLAALVSNLGGFMLNQFPEKDQFNKGSHPYLHENLGPIFLLHDGTIDLSIYKNDVDKMYTVFTESEFISFLLKRNINTDQNPNPIPVVKETD